MTYWSMKTEGISERGNSLYKNMEFEWHMAYSQQT